MAAFGAIQELIWTKGVLSEMEFHYVGPMNLFMDSKSVLRTQLIISAVNILISSITGLIREHTHENGTVELVNCKTEDMHVDVMTKTLVSDYNKHAIISVEMKMFEKEVSGV